MFDRVAFYFNDQKRIFIPLNRIINEKRKCTVDNHICTYNIDVNKPCVAIRDVLEHKKIFNFKRATIFDKGKHFFLLCTTYATLKP